MKYSKTYLLVIALSLGGIVAGLDSGSKQQRQVTMYGTSWCGYCAKARQYFISNDISFVEYDIEKNAQAKKKYDSLGGKGTPLIVVDEKNMTGFSELKFTELYEY